MADVMETFEAYEDGELLLSDLETNAVYETQFYLRYPVPPEKIVMSETWLNQEDCYNADDQTDTLAFGMMADVMDEDMDYTDDMKEAFGNGLIKKFVYKFDNEQSGKLYMEVTRELTDEELEAVQDYLYEMHCQGLGDLSEDFNVFLGKDRILDVWNTWDNAERQTTFEMKEIPLEKYFGIDDFSEAVDSIPVHEPGMEQ